MPKHKVTSAKNLHLLKYEGLEDRNTESYFTSDNSQIAFALVLGYLDNPFRVILKHKLLRGTRQQTL